MTTIADERRRQFTPTFRLKVVFMELCSSALLAQPDLKPDAPTGGTGWFAGLPLPLGEGRGEGLLSKTECRHAGRHCNPSPSHRFAAGPSLSQKERDPTSD